MLALEGGQLLGSFFLLKARYSWLLLAQFVVLYSQIVVSYLYSLPTGPQRSPCIIYMEYINVVVLSLITLIVLYYRTEEVSY